eukprot:6199322-Pleurochrysis_carterae.AAC.1
MVQRSSSGQSFAFCARLPELDAGDAREGGELVGGGLGVDVGQRRQQRRLADLRARTRERERERERES